MTLQVRRVPSHLTDMIHQHFACSNSLTIISKGGRRKQEGEYNFRGCHTLTEWRRGCFRCHLLLQLSYSDTKLKSGSIQENSAHLKSFPQVYHPLATLKKTEINFQSVKFRLQDSAFRVISFVTEQSSQTLVRSSLFTPPFSICRQKRTEAFIFRHQGDASTQHTGKRERERESSRFYLKSLLRRKKKRS